MERYQMLNEKKKKSKFILLIYNVETAIGITGISEFGKLNKGTAKRRCVYQFKHPRY